MITALARRWSDGDDEALERLIELTYPTLRRLAGRQVRSGTADPTIDTTALVHEAYLKLAGDREEVWPSRGHFFAFCSKVMRRIVIDYARHRAAEKRGGTLVHVPLADDALTVEEQTTDVLQVEAALARLASRSQRMAEVVECRFYGGLSIAETAEALGASPRTVVREWTRARAYLLRELDLLEHAPPTDEGRPGPA